MQRGLSHPFSLPILQEGSTAGPPWESPLPSAPPLGRSLELIPQPVPPPCHPLPALQSQLHQQQAGLRGRGPRSPGRCGAPWINSALLPWRNWKREMQSLISGADKQLGVGAGILHGQTFHGQPAPGSNPAAPCQVLAWHKGPACSLTGRGILVREGKGPETSRSGPERSRNGPERSLHLPPHQSPTCCSGTQLLLPAPFPIHVLICRGYLCKK